LPFEALTSQEAEGFPSSGGALIGISLSRETFRPEGSAGEENFAFLEPMVSRLRPAVLTTWGDVPAMSEMKRLTMFFGEVPRTF
jgi:hypothetical protein